jgi:hypothetical protein
MQSFAALPHFIGVELSVRAAFGDATLSPLPVLLLDVKLRQLAGQQQGSALVGTQLSERSDVEVGSFVAHTQPRTSCSSVVLPRVAVARLLAGEWGQRWKRLANDLPRPLLFGVGRLKRRLRLDRSSHEQ